MQDCVTDRIKEMFPDCIGQPAVHRLDMDTSGLMVIARTSAAHRHLPIQFEQRLVDKKYIALLEGIIDQADQRSGEITLPFRLDPDNRPHQIYDPLHGKTGVSRWQLLGIEGTRRRIKFTPLTGRTHQLRLHAAHPLGIGIPIIGERLYSLGQQPGELLLPTTSLAFWHPVSGIRLIWNSPPAF